MLKFRAPKAVSRDPNGTSTGRAVEGYPYRRQSLNANGLRGVPTDPREISAQPNLLLLPFTMPSDGLASRRQISLCLVLSAMTHLDKVKVYGKQVKVTPSKHSIVQMPKEGQPVSTPAQWLSLYNESKESIFVMI